MSDVVLSASSAAAYLACEYRWYLQYVEAQAGEGSIPRAVGIAVHAGVEGYFKTLSIDIPEAAWLDALSTYHLSYLLETAAIADPDEDPVKARAQGVRVLQSYVEDVAPTVGMPLMIEQAATFEVNDIPYSVHIDLVDEHEVIRDLKVKKAKPRRPDDYAFSMTGYALAYRFLTGRVESDLQIDVMIRLKRDRPYLVPYPNGGPVSDHDIYLFAETLERVATGIARQRFSPTGLEKGICRWCPVLTTCEFGGALYATTTSTDDDVAYATYPDDIGAK